MGGIIVESENIGRGLLISIGIIIGLFIFKEIYFYFFPGKVKP